MKFQLLDSLAARGGASLHARGRIATRALLGHLPRDLAGPVLEIGCGTGETAVQLCQYAETVVAADTSARMLKCACGRSKWCGVVQRMQVVQVSKDGTLPFATGAFAAIVIESVLAIQNRETMHRLVRECVRIVRRHGRVLVNETVWMTDTSQAFAEKINRRAAESVGMIQASLNPFDANAWLKMFEACGLSLIRKQRLDDVPVAHSWSRRSCGILIRSRAYTAMKSLGALMAPNGIADRRRITRTLGDLAPQRPCLEGILFVLKPSGTS